MLLLLIVTVVPLPADVTFTVVVELNVDLATLRCVVTLLLPGTLPVDYLPHTTFVGYVPSRVVVPHVTLRTVDLCDCYVVTPRTVTLTPAATDRLFPIYPILDPSTFTTWLFDYVVVDPGWLRLVIPGPVGPRPDG